MNAYTANGYGLYNVVGNVSEWIWDNARRIYTAAPVTDPRGPSGSAGWTRGSSFDQAISGGRLSSFVGRYAPVAQLGLGRSYLRAWEHLLRWG